MNLNLVKKFMLNNYALIKINPKLRVRIILFDTQTIKEM